MDERDGSLIRIYAVGMRHDTVGSTELIRGLEILATAEGTVVGAPALIACLQTHDLADVSVDVYHRTACLAPDVDAGIVQQHLDISLAQPQCLSAEGGMRQAQAETTLL